MLRDLLLVFVGGAVGTALRAVVLLPDTVIWHQIGVPTVNVVGAFLLGLVNGLLARREETERTRAVRLLVGTGVLGGFTTYSALAVQATDGWWVLAALATVVVGTAAAWLGLRWGGGAR